MVMHARKPQRASDGYFDKHQTHPYQKYNSKGDRRIAGEYETHYSPLRSPNGNISSHSHGHTSHSHSTSHHQGSHHHYAHCVDERGYSSRSYSQKSSEKERDRDYKSSRDKYADDVRSPKEKRSKDIERERSNHERIETESKKNRDRVSTVNSSSTRSNKFDKRSAPSSSNSEWSEHISSSGKKYYYNCVSEVSQWEKPREWDNRRHPVTSSKETTTSYASRNADHEKRTISHSAARETEKTKRSNSGQYWNSNSGRNAETDAHAERPRSSKHASGTTHEEGQSQDMDISPGGSTPLSENSYKGSNRTNACNRSNTERNAAPTPVMVIDHTTQARPMGVTRLAGALPRMVSGPGPMQSGVANNGALVSPQEAPTPPVASVSGTSCTAHRDKGPPTPTHSENTDPHAPPPVVETALPRKMDSLGTYSAVVGVKSCLYQLPHTVPPPLTPSLVNHVRSDLTHHVNGWPADMLEKQAHKYTEDAYILGCLQISRVCSELKCARSLVRHTEIQATLQEQKLMYLRQQIARMEELKSQNTFMADTS